eukprot:13590958-Alexandrium_andersonii.AAC.1
MLRLRGCARGLARHFKWCDRAREGLTRCVACATVPLYIRIHAKPHGTRTIQRNLIEAMIVSPSGAAFSSRLPPPTPYQLGLAITPRQTRAHTQTPCRTPSDTTLRFMPGSCAAPRRDFSTTVSAPRLCLSLIHISEPTRLALI